MIDEKCLLGTLLKRHFPKFFKAVSKEYIVMKQQ